MNNFTEIINEARKNYDSGSLLSSEISQYLNKVNKIIPKQVQDVIYLTQKYKLYDAGSIDEIRDASKSSLKALAKKYEISLESLENFWKMIKELKSKIRLLPQYQSAAERESIQLGKLSMDDLTIDLESAAGRNAATKMYMPMIYKIVNQYLGRSSLSKQELISAALQGFANAINDWNKDKDPEVKKVTFKTYAGYRAQQQILNDMNWLSHTLSGTHDYAIKKYGDALDTVSLDGLMSGDDEVMQDRLAALGTNDKHFSPNEEDLMKNLCKMIENKFDQRTVNIFYRYFGLNGYKKEKAKDIGKSINKSSVAIFNMFVSKVLDYLRSDEKAMHILSNLQDIYNENLMCELMGFSKEEILEALVNDDMFILLEELNQWKNKNVFNNMYDRSCHALNGSEVDIINDILAGDFETLDSNYKKYKKIIIKFLSNMYPTESFTHKTDVNVLELMQEIQKAYKNHVR